LDGSEEGVLVGGQDLLVVQVPPDVRLGKGLNLALQVKLSSFLKLFS